MTPWIWLVASSGASVCSSLEDWSAISVWQQTLNYPPWLRTETKWLLLLIHIYMAIFVQTSQKLPCMYMLMTINITQYKCMLIFIQTYMHGNFWLVDTKVAMHIHINDNEHYINGNVWWLSLIHICTTISDVLGQIFLSIYVYAWQFPTCWDKHCQAYQYQWQ